ncbi:dickkopf-related protein 3 isoform X1 [Hydra vulgaris]|uniref:dickkopf-related protein 3 isoform X1 n=1 Tax=Hydra vulgaris TaxID=6087 RepID=UPI0001924EB9|nr:dickkopf-related protein 3 isoform X2 [Hydra vulgaris]
MTLKFFIEIGLFLIIHGNNMQNDENLARDFLQLAIDETKFMSSKKNSISEVDQSTEINDKAKKKDELCCPGDIYGRCDINQQCIPGYFCDGMFCYKCHQEGQTCNLNGVCCEGSECQYGICTKGVKAGDAGTFCDLSKDCTGSLMCCIREMSINRLHSICKPMLEEHESCGPINLFHQEITTNAHVEPMCGPCKPGLSCQAVGIHGQHNVCLRVKDS